MKALDVAVQSIATRIADSTQRQRVLGLLESMANDCKSVMDLWQQVLKQPITPEKEVAVLMNWTGPTIAKNLFDTHLAFRSKMLQVTNQRGNLEDPVIPTAFHLLKPGESGTSYAQTALEQSRQAMLAMQRHIEMIRNTVPKKVAATPVAVKKGAKKAVTKKAAVKKVVTKTVAKKKPVAKKSVVKKSPAKKPVAKKAATKKALTKSAVTKKAVAKKPAPKQAVKKKAKKK